MTILCVIAYDLGTITPIQGVGFAIRELGSFHLHIFLLSVANIHSMLAYYAICLSSSSIPSFLFFSLILSSFFHGVSMVAPLGWATPRWIHPWYLQVWIVRINDSLKICNIDIEVYIIWSLRRFHKLHLQGTPSVYITTQKIEIRHLTLGTSIKQISGPSHMTSWYLLELLSCLHIFLLLVANIYSRVAY